MVLAVFCTATFFVYKEATLTREKSDVISTVVAQTTPPNGKSTKVELVKSTDWSRHWRWEVSTKESPEAFTSILTEQLVGFSRNRKSDEIGFVKTAPGDAYYITLRVLESTEGHFRYLIHFAAHAD